MAFAVSPGLAKRPMGMAFFQLFSSSVMLCPPFFARASIKLERRAVAVAPGRTLFTVIPDSATSLLRVFAQLATAQRVVFDTPSPGMGSFTEVEMMLMIVSQPF